MIVTNLIDFRGVLFLVALFGSISAIIYWRILR